MPNDHKNGGNKNAIKIESEIGDEIQIHLVELPKMHGMHDGSTFKGKINNKISTLRNHEWWHNLHHYLAI